MQSAEGVLDGACGDAVELGNLSQCKRVQEHYGTLNV
jgi:hypothetical protein